MRRVHSAKSRLVAWAAFLLAPAALAPTCLHAQEPQAAVSGPVAEKAQRLPGKYSAEEPTLAIDTLGEVLIAAIEAGDGSFYGSRIMLWRSENGGRAWPQPSLSHPQFSAC